MIRRHFLWIRPGGAPEDIPWKGYASILSIPGPGCYLPRARWRVGQWVAHFTAAAAPFSLAS